ncbi:MAG: hypothetical protein ACKVP7_19120 [Hyphomicrobiaceae bacterium]
MMLRYQVLAAIAAMGLGVTPMAAQQPRSAAPIVVDVGGRAIKLLLPDGQCALDRNQRYDANVLDISSRAIQGANDLLLHTAGCKNLDDARAGRTPYLNDFHQAQVALQFKQTELQGQEAAAAKEICQSLRSEGAQIEKEVGAEIKDRIKNLEAGIKVNETKALGVLAEDQLACYSGLLMNVQTPTGDKRLILGVYSMGVLNGRLIFLYHFRAEPPAGAVDRMVEQQKQIVRQHVAINNGQTGSANK